ncbi:MAG: adenosylmethionine--8-amino-7-oxononanoate transaminase [Myxococcota bacterium]
MNEGGAQALAVKVPKRPAPHPLVSEAPPWYEAGLPHIWLPYTQMKTTPAPLPVRSASGSRITLSNGRELIDGIASWWTACHGYAHPALVAAMQAQLAQLPHMMFGGLVHEPALKLAARLAQLLPGDLSRTFFSDSGSVSVEVAMKVAIQHHRQAGHRERNRFVSFLGGYHGDTLGTMAVADPEEGMHALFRPVLRREHVVPLPKTPATQADFARFLQREKDIAAVVIEPRVQGAGGMRFHSAETLRAIADACTKAGVLLIADEIFVAFGRTGSLFACETAGVTPDIITLSKALTGGMSPLAATVVRESVAESFWSDDPMDALMHGPTYMAHALGCAAANASLDLFEREPRIAQVAAIEAQLREGLEPLRELHNVADVRVLGAIGVVQLEDPGDLEHWKLALLKEGVWVRPFRDILYLTPALTIDESDLEALIGAIGRVLRA